LKIIYSPRSLSLPGNKDVDVSMAVHHQLGLINSQILVGRGETPQSSWGWKHCA